MLIEEQKVEKALLHGGSSTVSASGNASPASKSTVSCGCFTSMRLSAALKKKKSLLRSTTHSVMLLAQEPSLQRTGLLRGQMICLEQSSGRCTHSRDGQRIMGGMQRSL